jgi:hypothetical protein
MGQRAPLVRIEDLGVERPARRLRPNLSREEVLDALARSNGHKSFAADMLGVEYKQISYAIKKHALDDLVAQRWPTPPRLPRGSSDAPPEAPGGGIAAGVHPITPWPERSGVYFVFVGPMVKIGQASNIASRMNEIQSSCPYRIRLLAVVADDDRAELALHRRFSAHRRHREWFDAADEIVDFVRRVRAAA